MHFLFLGRLELPLITLFSLTTECMYIYAWHALLSLAAASLAKCQPLLAFLFRNSYPPLIPVLLAGLQLCFFWRSTGGSRRKASEACQSSLSDLGCECDFFPPLLSSSVDFSIFGVVQPSLRSSLEPFHHPKEKLHTPWHALHISSQFFQSLATTNLLYVSVNLPVLDTLCKWNQTVHSLL